MIFYPFCLTSKIAPAAYPHALVSLPPSPFHSVTTSSATLTISAQACRIYFSSAFGFPLTTLRNVLPPAVEPVRKTSPRSLIRSVVFFVKVFAASSAAADTVSVPAAEVGDGLLWNVGVDVPLVAVSCAASGVFAGISGKGAFSCVSPLEPS